MSSRKAFTLIELLVVIAIIAILAVVVVLTLNPAQLLAQSRDASRVSDLDTLAHALSLYQTDQSGASGYAFGNASSVYLSLPDQTLSGNATSTCTSLGLPALPAGYTYQCASPQSYRDTDGTGWIPINFRNVSTGSPIGSLPVDPTNSSSSGFYYTYSTNGSQYEITSLFESQKYKIQYLQNPIVPNYPELDAKGSSFAVSPVFNPQGLIGWWPLTEGTGTFAQDLSGNGNGGTWSGTQAGTNSTYYTAGRVGLWAGYFNGSNDMVSVTSTSILPNGSFSLSYWVNSGALIYGTAYTHIAVWGGPGSQSFIMRAWSGSQFIYSTTGADTQVVSVIPNFTVGAWQYVVIAYNASNLSVIGYLNGVQVGSATLIGAIYKAATPLSIGGGNPMNGSLNDVRIYNRALSPAEVQAIYNAEK